MLLKLQLENINDEQLEQPVTAEMRGTRFTIGRAKDNDWVLSGTFKTVSRHHCRIECRDDSYYVVSLKKNVGLARTKSWLQEGQAAVLQDNDLLLLGNCRIRLRIIETTEEPRDDTACSAHVEQPGATGDEKITDAPATHPINLEDFFPSPEDLLDPERAKRRLSTARQSLPRSAPPQPVSIEPEPPPQAADQTDLLHAFLKGAGLGKLEVSPEQAEAMMEELGCSFQVMIASIIEMLAARHSGRRELRAQDLTMLGPVQVNPLKFPPSKNWHKTLATMLLHDNPSYMPLEEAVGESLEDIKSHQLAIMETMREALQGLLERFDPANLEKSLESPSLLEKLWSHERQARCWLRFSEEYEKIVEEAREDFLSLIRDHFSDSQQKRHDT